MKRTPKGFTLIELLVVMSVIIVLASLTVGIQRFVYSSQSEAKAKAELHAISTALETFKLKYGDYPWLGSANSATSTGIISADTSPDLYKVLSGDLILKKNPDYSGGEDEARYIMAAPATVHPLMDVGMLDIGTSGSLKFVADPWGNPYKYSYKSKVKDTNWQSPGFTIISMGPNGKVTSAIFNRVRVGDMPTESEFRAETEEIQSIVTNLSADESEGGWPSYDDVVPNMQ